MHVHIKLPLQLSIMCNNEFTNRSCKQNPYQGQRSGTVFLTAFQTCFLKFPFAVKKNNDKAYS